MSNSILVKSQVKQLVKENVTVKGQKYKKVVCNIRYDDQCGNGHNTFAITGGFYENQIQINNNDPSMCGCCHDELSRVFPEIKHLIKWHLVNSDGPMYYAENTMYHARDTDTDGLKKGEYKAYKLKVVTNAISSEPVVLFSTGEVYTNKINNPNLAKSNDKELAKLNEFTDTLTIPYEVMTVNSEWALSEGKEPNIKAARDTAIWPEATLEQLLDKDVLQARLPALMATFQSDIESFGFTF
ncbi:hypothetical protein KASIA_p005 [Shewanella phage vB_SspS_KASIA]|nr:hypothetical protein KASIA_p005 [Shewanella phage vB_SspS_KASIA]